MHFLSQTAVKSSIPGAAAVVDITQQLAANCFQLAKDKFGSKVGPITSLPIEHILYALMTNMKHSTSCWSRSCAPC